MPRCVFFLCYGKDVGGVGAHPVHEAVCLKAQERKGKEGKEKEARRREGEGRADVFPLSKAAFLHVPGAGEIRKFRFELHAPG